MIAEDYYNKFHNVLIQSKPNPDYQTGGGSGVLVVGGGKYWYGIYVMVKLLRKLGCTLPVEVWYRGECESVFPGDLADDNTTFHDVDKLSKERGDSRIPRGNVKSGGWEAKLYALYHTKFDKVAYVDADAYYVNDPSIFLDKLEEHPFIYWQDLASQERSIKWHHVYAGGPGSVMQVQGGQLFINRNTAWLLVHLCHYMCQNSDYYFKHFYGDQDSWRVGLAAIQKELGQSIYWNVDKAKWQGVAFTCSFEGKPYIIHRCQGKLFAHKDIPPGKQKYSNPQYYMPMEDEVFQLLSEVINKQHYDSNLVFTSIYDKKLWGGNSGSGSTPREGKPFLECVNKFIDDNKCTSVVDVGCGDGLIGSNIKVQTYIGVDCCPRMVRYCSHRYPKNNYFPLDFYKDSAIIPEADILICKDVLHHWPNEMVVKWLSDLIESKKWKHIILCQDEQQRTIKQDCFLGGYRALSPIMEPLNKFPFKRIGKCFHKAILVYSNE